MKDYLIKDLRKHFDTKSNMVLPMHHIVINHQKNLTLGLGSVNEEKILKAVR